MNGVEKIDLKPGEWVEVRSESEILATLDDQGALDGVPFMPEMLAHCGRRYQVYKRADKTCDTVTWTGVRRMERTVHLKMLRCDGSGHGGCQAACLLFWKEAWLQRSAADGAGTRVAAEPRSASNGAQVNGRDRAWLEATTRRSQPSDPEILYRCQATQLVQFSSPLPWWEPKQYVRDVCMNDVSLFEVARSVSSAAFSKIRKMLTGRAFPSVTGTLKKTPTESLGLQPGEWVVTKSKAEILATLDTRGRNRGMTFDSEMLPFCGKPFRVLRRVERLIEESTGRMIQPPGVSIILENVFCLALYRRSCPRSIYPYWREIWLRRATPDEIPKCADAAQGTSETQDVGQTGIGSACSG
jgi:hypothetical protein